MLNVVIESPYAGDIERNMQYLRSALRDSLLRGEAPFASHGLYTLPGVLDDSIPEERSIGMLAGFAWTSRADLIAVYGDYGLTNDMLDGIKTAERFAIPVEYRNLFGRPGSTGQGMERRGKVGRGKAGTAEPGRARHGALGVADQAQA